MLKNYNLIIIDRSDIFLDLIEINYNLDPRFKSIYTFNDLSLFELFFKKKCENKEKLIVIVDKEMNGYESLQMIKKSDKSIPVILTSDSNDILNALKALVNGADAFVDKRQKYLLELDHMMMITLKKIENDINRKNSLDNIVKQEISKYLKKVPRYPGHFPSVEFIKHHELKFIEDHIAYG